MGTVTNLKEYRDKKSLEQEPRPMTHAEWIEYINSPDYEVLSAAVQRCIEIRGELTGLRMATLLSGGDYYRFSHAFRRCTLQMELAELAEKYNLVLFKVWI